MIRDTYLTVRTNANERRLAAAVAARMERTESDTVRLLLREKARELGISVDGTKERYPLDSMVEESGVHL